MEPVNNAFLPILLNSTTLICALTGTVLIVGAAAIPSAKRWQIYVQTLLREAGAALLVAAVVLTVHVSVSRTETSTLVQRIERWLDEAGKRWDESILKSLQDPEIASAVDHYALKEPILYRDVSVRVSLSEDVDRPSRCLIGTSHTRFTVENRSAGEQPFPWRMSLSEFRKGCAASKFHKATFIVNGGQPVTVTADALKAAETRTEEAVFVDVRKVEDWPRTIPGGGTVEVIWDATVAAGLDDRYVHQVRYPSVNLALEVRIPTTMVRWESLTKDLPVRFWHPAERSVKDAVNGVLRDGQLSAEPIGDNGYIVQIRGGVLPYGAVEIKWEPVPGADTGVQGSSHPAVPMAVPPR